MSEKQDKSRPAQHELINREVNVTPGRPGVVSSKEGAVGDGRGCLRVHNRGRRENEFKITYTIPSGVTWDRRRWLKVSPQSTPNQETAPDITPDEQTATVTIRAKTLAAAGQTATPPGFWDVYFPFSIPIEPQAPCVVPLRSQVIPISVVTEQKASNDAMEELVEAHTMSVIVRPIYKWSATLEPSEDKDGERITIARIGFFRRKAIYRLEITNNSNEWLYLKLTPVARNPVVIKAEAVTVAIEPASDVPGVREIKFEARSSKRRIFNTVEEYSWHLKVDRVDAPSIARLPSGALTGASDAGLGSAVLCLQAEDAETGDLEKNSTRQVDAILVHRPLIYKKIQELGQAIFRTVQGIFAMVLLGMVTLVGLHLAYTHIEMRLNKAAVPRPVNPWVQGQPLFLTGKPLGQVRLVYEKGGREVTKDVSPSPALDMAHRGMLKVDFKEVQGIWDDLLNSEKVQIKAYRVAQLWSFISSEDPANVEIAGKEKREPLSLGIPTSEGADSFLVKVVLKTDEHITSVAPTADPNEKCTFSRQSAKGQPLPRDFYRIILKSTSLTSEPISFTFKTDKDREGEVIVRLSDTKTINPNNGDEDPKPGDDPNPPPIVFPKPEPEGTKTNPENSNDSNTNPTNPSTNVEGDQLAELIAQEVGGELAGKVYSSASHRSGDSDDDKAIRAYALAALGRAAEAEKELYGVSGPLSLVARARILAATQNLLSTKEAKGNALALLELYRGAKKDGKLNSMSTYKKLLGEVDFSPSERKLKDALGL